MVEEKDHVGHGSAQAFLSGRDGGGLRAGHPPSWRGKPRKRVFSSGVEAEELDDLLIEDSIRGRGARQKV